MAAFRFNFGSESSDENEAGSGESEDEVRPDDKQHLKEAKEIIFQSANASLPSERDAEELALADGRLHLKHVLSSNVELSLKSGGSGNGSSSPSDIVKAAEVNSDLVPLVYEGGHKVWECSEDLVEFLFDSGVQMSGLRVGELGCGAALPGIYALLNGATVDFQDYNEDVIQHVTIPNILLNLAQMEHHHHVHCKDLSSSGSPIFDIMKKNCRFFAGDWGTLLEFINPDLNDEETYDIILSSETIYSLDSQKRLYQFIERHLKKPTGVAYIAAKTCYFGVGGGTRSFEELVTSCEIFDISVCRTFSTGVHREILLIKFKQ